MLRALILFVNVFLSLITKRVLDSLLEAWKQGRMHAENWFAVSTLIVILSHTFVVFVMLISDDFQRVLEKVHTRLIRRMFVATLVVLIVVYGMADVFVGKIDEYIVFAGALSITWLIFDSIALQMFRGYYRQQKSPGATASAMSRIVGSWIFCDILLITYMASIWCSYRYNKIDSVDAGWLLLALFSAIAYLVQHSLAVASRLQEVPAPVCGAALLPGLNGTVRPFLESEPLEAEAKVGTSQRKGGVGGLLLFVLALFVAGRQGPRRPD